MQLYNDPWPHIVIEDFFDESVLKELQNAFSQMKDDDIYFNHATGKKHIYSCEFDKNNLELPNPTLDNHNKLEEYIEFKSIYDIANACVMNSKQWLELLGCKKDFKYITIGFQKITKDYVAVPHVDGKNKILSLVCYMHPDDNIGTDIMIDNMNTFKTITWKKNRALIFSREENTWHNFRANNLQDRIIFTVNLTS